MSRSSLTLAAILVTAGTTLAACATDATDIDFVGDAGTTGEDASAPTTDGGATVPDATPPANDAGATCGNGKKEGAEACDDGNAAPNDGCSPTCAVESTSAADVCPGAPVPLTPVPGQPQLARGAVTGSTGGAYNHYGSTCGGGSGKDVVYAVTSPTSGRATVKLTAGFAAMVSARATCDDAQSEAKCGSINGTAGGTTTLEVPVFANAPLFLFVDGYGGSSGEFQLEVEVSGAVCGNGIAELPEACDDGNATNGDGCSASCTLEDGGILTNCPGQPFSLTGVGNAPRKVSFAGDTLKDGASTQSSQGCFHGGGNNVVYGLKSDVDGSVSARLLPGYARAGLHARSDCGNASYQLGCTNVNAPEETSLEFPVKAGEWFYVFVDAWGQPSRTNGGPYSLDVTVTPRACGNGKLDGNEQCDDGNDVAGDGCAADCTFEPTPAASSCPGHAVTLLPRNDGSRSAVVSGTTVGKPNVMDTCTALQLQTTTPDQVYAVTPDVTGRLVARVKGPYLSSLSVRTVCAPPAATPNRTTFTACSWNVDVVDADPWILTGSGSDAKTVSAPVVANTTYYVMVDGYGNTPLTGPFQLDLEVLPGVCGNGVIDGNEQCDDGAAESDDGCSATCQLEAVTRNTCADAEPVALVADPNAAGTFTASLKRGTTNLPLKTTAQGSHDFAPLATSPCASPGREAYFQVTAPAEGILRAKVTSDAIDAVLGFRKPCATRDFPLVCADDAPKGAAENVARAVTAGETVWIVVDTANTSDAGRFTLDVSITPSGCGDGFFVATPDEQCDDGNKVAGDGCSPTCKLEPKAGADTCPGVLLPLVGAGFEPRKGVITLDTSALTGNYTSACGGNAKDGVVRVVPSTNGLLRAQVKGMPNGVVYGRAVCADPMTEFFKTNGSTCPFVVHDVTQFQVTANQEYFLFVDGLDGATGVPTLEVTVTP